MDWLQFISAMTGHLAWPLAGVVIAFLFREQVRNLLQKMRNLKGPGGIEASFSEEVKKAAEDAKDIRAETARFATPESFHRDLKIENIRTATPRDMMLRSWKWLEDAVREYAQATGAAKEVGPNAPFDDVVIALVLQNTLPTKTLGILEELRDLREELIRKELQPSRADAVYFMGTAHAVTDYIQALRHDHTKK